jgi:hypothetical protein
MTCSQNCDFVRMEVGSKNESAWCGMIEVDEDEIMIRSP